MRNIVIMGFYKLFLCCLLVLCCQNTKAQIDLKLTDSLNFALKKFDSFYGVDIYNNFYFKKENTLIKTNTEKEWEFADLGLGEITSVSILNPLQILIFYKSTNRIVLVDQFLNEIRQIDLNNLPEPKVAEWVANTKNKEVWLYNSLNNQLEFFNYQNTNNTYTTIPLTKNPISIAANFNTAFVLFKDSIKSYNNYGTLLKKQSADSIIKLKLQNNKLVGETHSNFIILNKELKPSFSLKKPKNTGQDFFLSNEKLYIYGESILYQYKVQLPSK